MLLHTINQQRHIQIIKIKSQQNIVVEQSQNTMDQLNERGEEHTHTKKTYRRIIGNGNV